MSTFKEIIKFTNVHILIILERHGLRPAKTHKTLHMMITRRNHSSNFRLRHTTATDRREYGTTQHVGAPTADLRVKGERKRKIS